MFVELQLLVQCDRTFMAIIVGCFIDESSLSFDKLCQSFDFLKTQLWALSIFRYHSMGILWGVSLHMTFFATKTH
jgi:hypothetical protein